MAAHVQKTGAIDFGDDDDDLDAAEAELMGLNEGENTKQPTIVKLRVFINMDEDDEDDDEKNVDLTQLFVRQDTSLPYFIEVSALYILILAVESC